jgi:hypothetical protein
MNEIGDRRPALLAVDAGAIRVQRVIAKLIAAENAVPPLTAERPVVSAASN